MIKNISNILLLLLSIMIVIFMTGIISAEDLDTGGLQDIGEKLAVDSLKSAAGEIFEDSVGRLNQAQDALDIIDRTVKQLGHVIHLNIIYEPEDGDNAIHLKEKADDENRRIKLEARLEYVWDGKRADENQGFQVISNKIDELPPREDIPVRWYLGPNYPLYMDLKAGDWEAAIPTFWNKTDSNGVATGYFYPKLDQPLGGERKVEEIEVEVVALIQAGLGITPWSLVDVAFGASEELIKPTNKKVKIRIERHVPTRWEGRLTVKRSVKAFGFKTSSGPTKEGEVRTTKVSTNALWDASLTVDNIQLDTLGDGSGDYEFAINGEGVKRETKIHLVKCDNDEEETPPRKFTETITRSGAGRGKEVGKLNLKLKVDPRYGKYVLAISDVKLGQKAFTLLYSNSGTEVHAWEDCNGKHSIPTGYDFKPSQEILESLAALAQPYPFAEWPQFDLDSKVLNDSITYFSEHLSKDKQIGYEVTTHIDWNLRRIENSN